ncbi:MAG: hypothetical protein U9Q82_06575 [Chloroflexota bacterium]|nr:hypothetical protein [Chloroflexota bacterium]
MSRENNTIWCDGCGVEINWIPLVKHGRHYCCQDCCDGIPCKCYRWSELDVNRRSDETGEHKNADNVYANVS